MKLIDWRRLQRFTQKQAAEHIGVTQPTIAKCEAGTMIPRPALMSKIMSATDGAVTANDFYAAAQTGRAA